MPTAARVASHRAVQRIAKAVLDELAADITPSNTEQSIAGRAADALRRRGAPDTWYYDCPALVLLGSRSCASLSGRDYRPASEAVGHFNVVTVDLSPCQGDILADCARTFCLENGRVTRAPVTADLASGMALLERLHAGLHLFARPQTTFQELAVWATREIAAAGFENLDFRRNFGHSIAGRREARLYIERGNRTPLGEAGFFTFEPHVRAVAGAWGFKHENIYFFDDEGRVQEL